MKYTTQNKKGYGWGVNAVYETSESNPYFFAFGSKHGLSHSQITNGFKIPYTNESVSIFARTVPSYYGDGSGKTKGLILEDDSVYTMSYNSAIPTKDELEELITHSVQKVSCTAHGMEIIFADKYATLSSILVQPKGYFSATINNNELNFQEHGFVTKKGIKYCTEYRLLTSTFNNTTNSYYYFYCKSTPTIEEEDGEIEFVTWSDPITGFTSETHVTGTEYFYMVLPLFRHDQLKYSFNGKLSINDSLLNTFSQNEGTTLVPYLNILDIKPKVTNGEFNLAITQYPNNEGSVLFETEYVPTKQSNSAIKTKGSVIISNNVITYPGVASIVFEKQSSETVNIPSLFLIKGGILYLNTRLLYSVDTYTSNHIVNFNYQYQFKPIYNGLVLPSIYKPFYINQILIVDENLTFNKNSTIYNGVGIGELRNNGKKTVYNGGTLNNGVWIDTHYAGSGDIGVIWADSHTPLERSKPLILCDYNSSVINVLGYSSSIGIDFDAAGRTLEMFEVRTSFLSSTYTNYLDEKISVNNDLTITDLMPNNSLYYKGVKFQNKTTPFLEYDPLSPYVIPFYRNLSIKFEKRTSNENTRLLNDKDFSEHLKGCTNIRYYVINKSFYDNYISKYCSSTSPHVDVYVNNREYYDINPNKFVFNDLDNAGSIGYDSASIMFGNQVIEDFVMNNKHYVSGWRTNTNPKLPFVNMYAALKNDKNIYSPNDYAPLNEMFPYAKEIISAATTFLIDANQYSTDGIRIIGCYSPLTCLEGSLYDGISDYYQEVMNGNKIIPQKNYTTVMLVYKLNY